MKRIYVLITAFAAICMFSALAVSSAFGLSQWLVNGATIPAGTSVPAETEGELILTDSKIPLLGDGSVLCSGILMGSLSSGGADEITEILKLDKVTVIGKDLTGEGLECTNLLNCPTPLVWPDNLPWLSQIELDANGMFWDHLFKDATDSNTGPPGYDIECMGTGTTDLCEGLVSFLLENLLEDVDGTLTLAEQQARGELGTCQLGGANAGDIETQGESLTTSPRGPVQVSDV